jgi:integrase
MTPRQVAQTKNHPAPGSIITVQPIIDKKAIERIKDNLNDHPRNYALFVTGINTAFRASDLLTLKVGDVRGDTIRRREIKTGKIREFYLNKAVKAAVAPLIEGRDDGDFLFRSEMTRYALTVEAFSVLVKIWCFNAGLKGNFASHTLRKTWGYWQRMAGEPLYKIMDAYGHSSEKTTLIYIGLQPEEMKSMYLREL